MAKKYFTTPRGIASYPKLLKPDTKFNAEGVYKTGLILDEEAAQPLIEQIEEVFTEEFGAKKLGNMVKPYTVNDEGQYVFSFKSKNKPQLFDAAGKPINPKADIKLGGGSVLKIKGSISPVMVQGKYYASLYINAAQVIELVEFGGAGFAAEEGSYRASEDTTGDDTESSDTDGTKETEDF
jgi:hypothetical protein